MPFFFAVEEAAQEAAPGPKAEFILSLFGLPVSNTVFSAWIVMALLVVFSILATRRMSLERPTGLQNLAEAILELWVGVIEQVAGRRGRRFLPLVVTSFIFILASNWFGVFPGFGELSWLRSPNSDLNLTAAMAIIMFIAIQVYALKANAIERVKEFLWPPALGQLHIVTELSRPLSLSFRLFGNIFAGEVLLHTMLGIAPYVMFVFLGLELFVGIIQALIFSMLSLVFLTIATMHEHAEHGHGEHGEAHH
ncbi:MAG: F0F1 ATP synthase subunit A [Chloroflexi bacterium]|nr:F0F1 ATP synthase subunit A [Chloroflexota bacterium]